MKCKFCKYYQIDGHRGGQCQILGVLVDGRQESCPLAVKAFCQSPETAALPKVEVNNVEFNKDLIWELERMLCLAISGQS